MSIAIGRAFSSDSRPSFAPADNLLKRSPAFNDVRPRRNGRGAGTGTPDVVEAVSLPLATSPWLGSGRSASSAIVRRKKHEASFPRDSRSKSAAAGSINGSAGSGRFRNASGTRSTICGRPQIGWALFQAFFLCRRIGFHGLASEGRHMGNGREGSIGKGATPQQAQQAGTAAVVEAGAETHAPAGRNRTTSAKTRNRTVSKSARQQRSAGQGRR